MEKLNIPALRQELDDFIVKHNVKPAPGVGMVTDHQINDTLRIRIYRNNATGEPLPAFVYLHGGGWIRGSIDTHDYLCRHLAETGAFTIVSVDYRLAPEYTYPAPVEDGFLALRWILEHANDIAVDTHRLAIGGDSVGGNIAIALAAQAQAQHIPIKALVVAYPPVNHYFQTASYEKYATGYGLTTQLMKGFWEAYIPHPEDRQLPSAAVIFNDFTGFPSTLIIGTDQDPLHDDGKQLLLQLTAAGVDVRYSFYAGTKHAFLLRLAVEEKARLAKDEIVNFLKQLL
ncbi:MAG: alpha/beta hydrolase [Chitinophaga sp.]|uniref:alpha/beta hydrolase n=1 Tax=Chitinophaga sp. TaxID=1869181 RepID=UPI001B080165|nr:alpha/beta hydrolase [Chitinophaga sp.]MBO9730236.1 alpha/beta hydrolase [Chitinophaga sp.]